MLFRIAADAVLALHLAFIVFAMLGGVLVLRWPRLALAQVPAAAWAVFIELTGRICPLTVVENHLRAIAGDAGYPGGFIEHYLLAIVYPEGLTRGVQLALAAIVLAINTAIYASLALRRRAKPL